MVKFNYNTPFGIAFSLFNSFVRCGDFNFSLDFEILKPKYFGLENMNKGFSDFLGRRNIKHKLVEISKNKYSVNLYIDKKDILDFKNKISESKHTELVEGDKFYLLLSDDEFVKTFKCKENIDKTITSDEDKVYIDG